MPLVKSPLLTAAKLAANRANAHRFTGPRNWAGEGAHRLERLEDRHEVTVVSATGVAGVSVGLEGRGRAAPNYYERSRNVT